MSLATVAEPEELPRFLAGLDPAAATRVRTLARAWEAAGGALQVGRLSIRLVARDGIGRTFTAATLQARRLELARSLLLAHGWSEAAWSAWCDERAELARHGFSHDAKFPAVDIGALTEGELARLALGLRDIAMAVCTPMA